MANGTAVVVAFAMASVVVMASGTVKYEQQSNPSLRSINWEAAPRSLEDAMEEDEPCEEKGEPGQHCPPKNDGSPYMTKGWGSRRKNGVGSAFMSACFLICTIMLMFRYYRKRVWRMKIISHDHAAKTTAYITGKFNQRDSAMQLEHCAAYWFEGEHELHNGTKSKVKVTVKVTPGLPDKLNDSLEVGGEAEVWYLPEEPRVCMLVGQKIAKSHWISDGVHLFCVQISVCGCLYFLRMAYRTYPGYAAMGTLWNFLVFLGFYVWLKRGKKCFKCWWKCVFPHVEMEERPHMWEPDQEGEKAADPIGMGMGMGPPPSLFEEPAEVGKSQI